MLVAELTRNLPGPFAGRELRRLGARVVRVEAPEGDRLRDVAPVWDARLNAGKESVVWDRAVEPELGRELCARADVLLEGFRPGVAERLGIGPGDLPGRLVYCSITGFGPEDHRAGHDLNYMGWAGALADTAPALPPVQVADLAAGALYAVTEILAALLERERTGHGRRIVVSMTHNAHRLVSHRLGAGERLLTGGLACYRIYECADGRFLTVAALEPKFWSRLCELLERPDLAPRHLDEDQEALATELAALFATRPLASWLERLDDEDAMAGPVATLEEGAAHFGGPEPDEPPPRLGEHTEAWRRELGR
jgi:crotonobetainyl-CoA:carnitine CoA-transferase CaiB-like acyl-CoA transferase